MLLGDTLKMLASTLLEMSAGSSMSLPAEAASVAGWPHLRVISASTISSVQSCGLPSFILLIARSEFTNDEPYMPSFYASTYYVGGVRAQRKTFFFSELDGPQKL